MLKGANLESAAFRLWLLRERVPLPVTLNRVCITRAKFVELVSFCPVSENARKSQAEQQQVASSAPQPRRESEACPLAQTEWQRRGPLVVKPKKGTRVMLCWARERKRGSRCAAHAENVEKFGPWWGEWAFRNFFGSVFVNVWLYSERTNINVADQKSCRKNVIHFIGAAFKTI